ncbi:hypothetical protein [Desulforudis sp. DRI-14]
MASNNHLDEKQLSLFANERHEDWTAIVLVTVLAIIGLIIK